MPLMTNPNRRQRNHLGIPRLRNRSLPRLRMGQQPQLQHDKCVDEEETVRCEGPTKSRSPSRPRRRSYSLPRRLMRPKQDPDVPAVDVEFGHESIETFLESSSTVHSEAPRRPQLKVVSFGDNVVDKEYEYEELEYEPSRLWYQEPDYTRFKKDRILTTFDYQASVQGNTTFNSEEHSIRGLEIMIHPRYARRISLEKKDLQKALQKEEAHQKETGKFPNLERFQVVSQRYTKDAQNRAHALGAEDAKDVQQGKGHGGKSWISRKLKFGAPPERGVRRHRSMDSEL